MANTISFNKESFQNFKNQYETSVKNNEEMFVFDGNDFLTSYAKYVIEYLRPKFM